MVANCVKDSCPVSYTDDVEQVYPLILGNKYRYYHVTQWGSYYYTLEIRRDSLINGKRYFGFYKYYPNYTPHFILDDLIRVENGHVYSYQYTGMYKDHLIFDYNAQVGDTIPFDVFEYGRVTAITEGQVFGEPQKLYHLVSVGGSWTDSVVFATKFGKIAEYGKLVNLKLVGAIIDCQEYGYVTSIYDKSTSSHRLKASQ
ncbi:MAG: hypothetical protein D6681_07050 [Calditrichaeota bacterium]|nr:MAG: hypothetical protein D6681_07050 [Calditrichota bacterium]